MKNTVYLLTGAAGYLGLNVCRALIAQDKAVSAFVSKDELVNDPDLSRIPCEAEIVYGDTVNPYSLEEFFSMDDNTEAIVIHCAGILTDSPELSEELYLANVIGTRNIINACIKYKAKKLVYVSSTDAIPELPRGEVIREVASFHPELVVGAYGKTKAMATQLVLDAVKEHELDASIVYPSGILGPNDHGGYFTNFFLDCVNGKIPAGVSGSFSAVDARDLAEGVIACAEKGRKGEGYIMSNDAVSTRELFYLVKKNSGAPQVKHMVPAFIAGAIISILSFFGFSAKKSGLPVSFAIYKITRNNDFSYEKAVIELGFKNRPFKIAVRYIALRLHYSGQIRIADEEAYNLDNLNYIFNLSPST